MVVKYLSPTPGWVIDVTPMEIMSDSDCIFAGNFAMPGLHSDCTLYLNLLTPVSSLVNFKSIVCNSP